LVDKSKAAFYDVGVAATIENVLKRTRSEILSCLRIKGRLTVEDLAVAIGVSKVCIRRHLDLLGRDQLIAYDVERQDRGRPSHVYYLTAKSESLFPTEYAAFAQGMLKQIGRQFGEPAIQAIIAGYAEEAITTFRCELEHKSGEERIQSFVALLNRSGYEANVSALENGGYVVEQRNCPVLALALDHQQICDEELRVYRNILDVDVVRECRIAGGFSSCIYKVFLSQDRTGVHSQSEASLEH
jgi:predicted ArsR family transcriptional regulator